MDFISDTVWAKRANAGRRGDVLIGGVEMSVSRKGFTLGSKAQEIGRVWVSGEETEIEGGDEKVCPKEVRGEERNVRSKTTGVRWGGGRVNRGTPESRNCGAQAARIRAFAVRRQNSEKGGGQGEVGEILGTTKMRESLMDM
jgi:hypothetical protein